MVIGDIGTVIDCNMRIDLTDATLLQIGYKKPSGAAGTWTGTLYGTETVRFITVAGNIDEKGEWQFQPYAEKPAWQGHGDIRTVMVGDVL